MSSINPGIAASASQTALQQQQIAAMRDAKKSDKERQAQKLKELINQHLESVEDTTDTDTDKLRIKDEEQEHQSQRRKQQQRDKHEDQGVSTDPEGQTHLDIEA